MRRTFAKLWEFLAGGMTSMDKRTEHEHGRHHGQESQELHQLHHIHHLLERIMATLDDVVTKVTALGTVEDSVVALLTDIKAKLDAAIAAGADPVKLQALSDAIDAQTQRLAAAVVANTPTP